VLGKRQRVKGEERLKDLERRIRLNGFYPLRCDPEEHRRLDEDEGHRAEAFARLMRQELERWLALASDKLTGTDVRCYVMAGNDDDWDIDEVLAGARDPVESCEGRRVVFDGIQMISSAWANPTPWNSPRELEEEPLLEHLEELAGGLEPGVPAIFNLHCPPFDSGLDEAPELSTDLRVMRAGGEPKMIPVGSKAVRALIERHQPMLGLHGHIHESRAATRIGRTVCVNPGSAYAEGVLDGAVVELDGGEIISYQLVSG
jgi:Icc-related predicted phosphoesterase